MIINRVEDYLEELYPNAFCELNYDKDYELLIAVVLSAQTTDKRVNKVTKVLWDKYNLNSLKEADIKDIEDVLRPLGTYTKKAVYIKDIASKLVTECDGIVPNNRSYLESLPGVGRKSANVVLSNLFNVPAIAVDTHVERVSKRLGLAKDNDTVLEVEKKLMKKFKKDVWSKRHHQLVLFGRYKCKAIKPECDSCKLNDICKHKKRID